MAQDFVAKLDFKIYAILFSSYVVLAIMLKCFNSCCIDTWLVWPIYIFMLVLNTTTLGFLSSKLPELLVMVVLGLVAVMILVLLLYSCFVKEFSKWVGLGLILLCVGGIVCAEIFVLHAGTIVIVVSGASFFLFGCHIVFSTLDYSKTMKQGDYPLAATLIWVDIWALITSVFKIFSCCC